MDTLDYMTPPPPTADRPLLGLTVLVVEDSIYASEALRLLSLQSGARLRRADSLAHARRHLAVYRPSVVVVDIGLPDGNGAELIAQLHRATPRIDVILGASGDAAGEGVARAAGADGFILKPISSITAFQRAILTHLPRHRQPPGPRLIAGDSVRPDPLAYREDLATVARALDASPDEDALGYLTQFLGGVAESVGDTALSDAVVAVADRRCAGRGVDAEVARLAAIVHDRLATHRPI